MDLPVNVRSSMNHHFQRGHQTSSPELEQWLSTHVAQGFQPESLVHSMLQAGYNEQFARGIVAASFHLSESINDTPVVRQAANAQSHSAEMVALASGNTFHHEGHDISVLFALQAPRIVLLKNLLTHKECDALVGMSRDRLRRSPVVDPESGVESLVDARTSTGAMFQLGEHALIARLERRIAALTGIPADHGEGLQILHYEPGGEYRPHFDFFTATQSGEALQLRNGGQRVATLVIYLNNPVAGGATAFPRVGLDVVPVKGNAVLFSYLMADGSLDDRTLHAGMPVEAGEKWIATKWLRERPYRPE